MTTRLEGAIRLRHTRSGPCDNGTVLGLAVAITDITARARADARLRLLSRAAMNVGTTLDIFRTAEELCDLAVPELADSMTVDVIDSVLRGEAPAPLAATETASLRRAGFRSAADDPQHGLAMVGEVGTHPFGTPYLRALSDLAPVLIRNLDEDTDWPDPARKLDARLLAAGVHSVMVTPMRARCRAPPTGRRPRKRGGRVPRRPHGPAARPGHRALHRRGTHPPGGQHSAP
ncbi:hypothetical protein [Streptomyces sp. NPDC090798]|uniref:hypothetical protein n=1 Tax=Streptomyces sp. NPDC090798 TaxID=3365968 RepID=UPI0038054C91